MLLIVCSYVGLRKLGKEEIEEIIEQWFIAHRNKNSI
jgi:hypothetical protein